MQQLQQTDHIVQLCFLKSNRLQKKQYLLCNHLYSYTLDHFYHTKSLLDCLFYIDNICAKINLNDLIFNHIFICRKISTVLVSMCFHWTDAYALYVCDKHLRFLSLLVLNWKYPCRYYYQAYSNYKKYDSPYSCY